VGTEYARRRYDARLMLFSSGCGTAPHLDLKHAPRSADGRVHFSSDQYVLRPIDSAKANGVLLFEIANRGSKGLLRFNRNAARSDDPSTLG